jgi:hypothetical protein
MMLTFPLRLGESEGALLGLLDVEGSTLGKNVGNADKEGRLLGCED